MPVTISITCDSDQELAGVLQNISFGSEYAVSTATRTRKSTSAAPKTKAAGAPKKATKSAAAAATSTDTTEKGTAGRRGRKPGSKAAAPKKSAASAPGRPGRKPKAVSSAAAPAKKAGRKPAATTKILPKKKATKAPKADGNGAGKSGKLVPLIQEAVQSIVKKGDTFRTRDITALVMKRSPDLNESSVTTGVSKVLGTMDLKFEQIKDAVGRPYKLYKP